MATIYLTIVAMIMALILSAIWSPLGGIWLVLLLFGLLISIRERQKRIADDIELIKQKLGIAKLIDEDSPVTNEDIEQELEEYTNRSEGKDDSPQK